VVLSWVKDVRVDLDSLETPQTVATFKRLFQGIGKS